MTPEKLLTALQDALRKELSERPNWSRGEINSAFDRAKATALLQFVSFIQQ